MKLDYQAKWKQIAPQTLFDKLEPSLQKFLREKANTFFFTLQELKQICSIANDLKMWQQPSLETIWPSELTDKKQILQIIKYHWLQLKNTLPDYKSFHPKHHATKTKLIEQQKKALGLGRCPVASPLTRCCQLYTLDAVDNCGLDCSYCCIQSFYSQGEICFDSHFKEKLKELKLDPNKIYHIGTGQSSDSLMWGNKGDILATLFDFARQNSNVILELKSKSDNIDYLLKQDIPRNIITTWSLNPEIIIEKEEHQTTSLAKRLNAAKKIAQKGNLIGFHFHPMIYYQNWKSEYQTIFNNILSNFKPEQIAMISFGTLTFTRSVLKKIQSRNFETLVTRIPLDEIAGKFSYPYQTKLEMFQFAYQAFAPWHTQVYFYLCMEDIRLWPEIFGYDYQDNDQFEQEMIKAYQEKISN